MRFIKIINIEWMEYWRDDLPTEAIITIVRGDNNRNILAYLEKKYNALPTKYYVGIDKIDIGWQNGDSRAYVELRHMADDIELNGKQPSDIIREIRKKDGLPTSIVIDKNHFSGINAVIDGVNTCGEKSGFYRVCEKDDKQFLHIEYWTVVWCFPESDMEVVMAISRIDHEAN